MDFFPCSNLESHYHKLFFVVLIIFTSLFLSLATEPVNSQKIVSFDLNTFTTGDTRFNLFEGAMILPGPDGCLSMTDPGRQDIGRAVYSTLVPIWDSVTGNVASFETSFSFLVYYLRNAVPGDGLVFFLTGLENFPIPKNSEGGLLGVADAKNAFNRFVGVEFDNNVNSWDPNYTHVGIDVNSLYSVNIAKWKYRNYSEVKMTIIYDSLSSTLTVIVSDEDNQIVTLSQKLDLKWLLPETVVVGISASSGQAQGHDIYSWSFRSVLDTTTRSSSNNITSNNNNITASY